MNYLRLQCPYAQSWPKVKLAKRQRGSVVWGDLPMFGHIPGPFTILSSISLPSNGETPHTQTLALFLGLKALFQPSLSSLSGLFLPHPESLRLPGKDCALLSKLLGKRHCASLKSSSYLFIDHWSILLSQVYNVHFSEGFSRDNASAFTTNQRWEFR